MHVSATAVARQRDGGRGTARGLGARPIQALRARWVREELGGVCGKRLQRAVSRETAQRSVAGSGEAAGGVKDRVPRRPRARWDAGGAQVPGHEAPTVAVEVLIADLSAGEEARGASGDCQLHRWGDAGRAHGGE